MRADRLSAGDGQKAVSAASAPPAEYTLSVNCLVASLRTRIHCRYISHKIRRPLVGQRGYIARACHPRPILEDEGNSDQMINSLLNYG